MLLSAHANYRHERRQPSCDAYEHVRTLDDTSLFVDDGKEPYTSSSSSSSSATQAHSKAAQPYPDRLQIEGRAPLHGEVEGGAEGYEQKRTTGTTHKPGGVGGGEWSKTQVVKHCQTHCPHLYALLSPPCSVEQKKEAFCELVCSTNTRQRQYVRAYFSATHGIDLVHYAEKHFHGVFKRLIVYALSTPLERHLYLLTIAVKKMKNIDSILPLLCVMDGAYLTRVLAMHNAKPLEKSLQSQILKLTAHNSMLRAFLTSVLSGSRASGNSGGGGNVRHAAVMDDVLFLTRILRQKQWSETDEAQFVDIFSRRSFRYLKRMAIEFQILNETSLLEEIRKGLSFAQDIGYAIYCILLYIGDAHEFYRKLLMKGIVDGGHKHILFWRIIIDRMDFDLQAILSSYGLYDGGKSDAELYNISHTIKVKLYDKDLHASKLLSKICNL
eukprot:CAMPEP_0202690060 /NCGR_PEP_ID=MMETSP1385-20130828/5189_1 /ASSEMBLY_ACC=CAM_ASM_000861 /TAXON_ID=933848 /ORGANISM="Elphidium margaritaceum" /LENGTH=439 /DNA_ID=CAMNT_0049345289 /DNA_START=79 /DNA_END=1398 /DNA_ORIENTATION=+